MRRRATHLLAAAAVLSVPAHAEARSVQIESGRLAGPQTRVVSDRAARGGRAVSLAARGWVRKRYVAGAQVIRVTIRARGLHCAGSPTMVASLDGRRLLVRPVRSRRYAGHRIAVRVRRGSHLLSVRLSNPRRTRTCRRRLVVDAVTFTERRAPASRTAPAPVAPVAPPPPPPPPVAYKNPVFAAPGAADPMVLDVGGEHSEYLTFSTGTRFPILRSTDLIRWTPAGTALTTRPDWAMQGEGDWNPWAPSVIERPGPCPGAAGTRCFVLFHVAKHDSFIPAMNCIGLAVSPVPEGPYEPLGPLENEDGTVDSNGRPPGCGDDAGYSNIDPAPFVDTDGKAYLYLSTGRPCAAPPPPGGTCAFDRTVSVIPLGDDLLSAAGPRVALFNGGAPPSWESGGFGPVVENPSLVKRGSTYVLLYSGGAFTGAYGMGYATGSSPTGPFLKAAGNPILREANGAISVGGGALVTGPRGGDWLAYHGREGSYNNPRQLRLDPVRFPSDTSVVVDGPTTAPQPAGP